MSAAAATTAGRTSRTRSRRCCASLGTGIAEHGARGYEIAIIGDGLVGAAIAFGLRSLGPRLAADLERETGIDVAYSQPGGVHVCLTPRELDHRIATLDALFAQPGFERHDVEMLDRAGLARKLPGVGPDVAGGTYCVQDGHCSPLKRACRGRPFLDALYLPADAFRMPVGDTIVCRCEEVTAQQVIDAGGRARGCAIVRAALKPGSRGARLLRRNSPF